MLELMRRRLLVLLLCRRKLRETCELPLPLLLLLGGESLNRVAGLSLGMLLLTQLCLKLYLQLCLQLCLQ